MIRDKLTPLMQKNNENEKFTGLILLSGIDAPGITESLFATLAPFSIIVLDIEQVVITNRLILTVLVTLNPVHQKAIEEDLAQCAESLDVDIATLFTTSTIESIGSKSNLLHVIILSDKLLPSTVSALASVISGLGANIERITRPASNPITVIEFIVSGVSQKSLTSSLSSLAPLHSIDIAVHKSGAMRFARKLVQLDVDSTLITAEVIDLLAAKAGAFEEVQKITNAAMRGEIDFEQSLRRRVSLLKGLPQSAIAQVQNELILTPGAQNLIETLHRLGHSISVVSGGFIDVIEPLISRLGILHFRANKLEIQDGLLTGEIQGTVIDRAAKAQALREFAALESISMEHTVAIGDGANDLDMIAAAGFGIAFNAKPAVRNAADSSVSSPYLDSVLYLLGITPEQ